MFEVRLGEDNPVLDREHPPGLAGFSCVSEGEILFGVTYYAEGLRNPTAVMCHGLPGIDKNHDIAQILRQAGFNVVIFAYRGAWGSWGLFSFSGCVEDTRNVLRHVQRGKLPEPFRFDPERIVFVGHSMGAFAAFKAASGLPEIRDIALMAVWNIGSDAKRVREDEAAGRRLTQILSGAGCLTGVTRGALLNEMFEKAEDFDLTNDASAFEGRRVLLIGADEDAFTPAALHQRPLAEALRGGKALVSEKTLACDHAFSCKRNAVARALLQWLSEGGY
jgi:pimeloyl-ACP methyl ester carboxylesterase